VVIKLGLLGKVVGFSILAIQISQIENFDPSQTASLLKALTGGLGIALLTTAVGLVTNMILGFQLARIDRFVDSLLADTVDWVQGG
jgi:biopolymer transport protein ExbB/TolQ